MDDELQQWASTWKKMEVREMEIVAKHLDAFRAEERQLRWGAFSVLLPIGLVGWGAWRFSLDTMLGSPSILIALGVSAVGLAVVVTRLIRTAYRLHGSRRSITDSPLSLVRDLIAFEERRLRRTSPRAIATAVGVCALYAAYNGYAKHDHPRQLALGLTMSLAMAVYLVVASRRISRRAGAELETLHRLHDELSDSADA